MTVTAYIALGSNLGDRRGTLDRAVAALRAHPRVEVVRVASYHETDPVGGPPGQGRYLNSAAELRTDLSPRELLTLLLEVEKQLGRQRGVKNAARTIDLDLLLYGQEMIHDDDLQVPHPRMWNRLFVLAPLAEIAAEVKHPAAPVSIRYLADLARSNEAVAQVKAEQNRLKQATAAIEAMLQANPHPRKLRHLVQALKKLQQEGDALKSRIDAAEALLRQLDQETPCQPE